MKDKPGPCVTGMCKLSMNPLYYTVADPGISEPGGWSQCGICPGGARGWALALDSPLVPVQYDSWGGGGWIRLCYRKGVGD